MYLLSGTDLVDHLEFSKRLHVLVCLSKLRERQVLAPRQALEHASKSLVLLGSPMARSALNFLFATDTILNFKQELAEGEGASAGLGGGLRGGQVTVADALEEQRGALAVSLQFVMRPSVPWLTGEIEVI